MTTLESDKCGRADCWRWAVYTDDETLACLTGSSKACEVHVPRGQDGFVSEDWIMLPRRYVPVSTGG